MKNFNENLSALLKARPSFVMLECPEFIAGFFQPKSRVAPKKAEPFWDIASAETAEPSVVNVYRYQPKFQEA
jgi:hypothetical protein